MKYDKPIYIVAAKRSPIGRFGGGLKDLSAVQIAHEVASGSLDASMISAAELTVAGQVLQAGTGMNGARQLSLACGIPHEVPAFTVNMVCGSGLKAVAEIANAIAGGEISCGLAAGMESMSQAPFFSSSLRWGAKYGDSSLRDIIARDGLTDPSLSLPMGETAEKIAEKQDISRVDQDTFAAETQRRASQSDFSNEIVPIKTKAGLVERDEHPRPDTTVEKLAGLKTAFRKDGTVTAGNASGLNDGAAILFVADKAVTKRHGWTPLAKIAGYTMRGCDPAMMGLGPIYAVRELLKQLNWHAADVDAFELNEAFAAQSIACIRELGLSSEKVNPRGGAIALGHPIGCSGARVLVSLIHYLKENDLKRGIATLCIGGGMGIAMAVEC